MATGRQQKRKFSSTTGEIDKFYWSARESIDGMWRTVEFGFENEGGGELELPSMNRYV